MSTLKVTHLQNENGTGPAMSIAVGGGVTFAGITTFHSNVDLGSNSLEGSLQVATGATISGSTNTITGFTNGSERFRVSNDGTFRVGTDSSNVQIAANTGLDINDGAINLYQATSNADAVPFLISSDVGGTETEKLRVTAGGYVGIGTDDPEGVIHTLASTNNHLVLESPDSNVDINGADTGGSTKIRSSGGEVKIYTGGDASAHNAANASLAATFDTSGNLVFPSGNGIDFSATADGSGASNVSEVFDDYEEGTWTPQITQGVTGTPNYSEQHGWYTKIGRIVTLYFYIRLATTGNTGSNTHIRVGNFPFPVASTISNNRNRGMGVSNYHSIPGFTAANVSFYGAGSSNTYASVYQGNTSVSTSSSLNNEYIIGGFEYISE